MNLKIVSVMPCCHVQEQNLKNDSTEEVCKATAEKLNTTREEVSTESPDNLSQDFRKRQVYYNHIQFLTFYAAMQTELNMFSADNQCLASQVSVFQLTQKNEKGRLISCSYQRHSNGQEKCSNAFSELS